MDRTLLESEFDDMGLSISDDIIDECKYKKTHPSSCFLKIKSNNRNITNVVLSLTLHKLYITAVWLYEP